MYPVLNTSPSFIRAELISIGNGYFSNNLGNRTIASHCSPILTDLRPAQSIKVILKNKIHNWMIIISRELKPVVRKSINIWPRGEVSLV